MTSWAHDPEASASALIASALDDLDLGNRALLASTDVQLRRRLESRLDAVLWSRRVAPSVTVQPDPPPGPYSSALLRLPKSRDEQIMTAHQCLGALEPSGRLYVYGGNSEGIRSFQKGLSELGSISTVAARGHGRILELKRGDVIGDVKSSHADWRQVLDDPAGWVTYPGLFAGGASDPGTALLLEHLPDITEGSRVLDYGCGQGAIAAAVRRRQPNAQLILFDNDSAALLAARENVPDTTLQLGSSLDDLRSSNFDLIISNPPLHVGFREDLMPLLKLTAEAPKYLVPTGTLLLVVQRRVALERTLMGSFAAVDVVADDGRYRVWRAMGRPVRRQQSGLKPQQ